MVSDPSKTQSGWNTQGMLKNCHIHLYMAPSFTYAQNTLRMRKVT
jgi:hypothetical protein